MLATGDFAGNYRIISQLSSPPDASLYLAEHTYLPGVMFLVLCPTITLLTDELRHRFLRSANGSSIRQDGQTFDIEEAGVSDQHPYFVTPYAQENQSSLQKYVGLLAQILQSTQLSHSS